MNQKTALAIIIALVIVFALTYVSFESARTKNKAPAGDVSQQVSFQGEFICLPLKSTSKAPAMECILGLKTDNKVYYAIDAQGESARNALFTLQTGLRIQIDGTLVPIEQISSDVWQKYDIGGILSTDSIKRI